MNLDLLDTSYTMVKYILHFEQFDQTGLTGLGKRFDQFPSHVNFGRLTLLLLSSRPFQPFSYIGPAGSIGLHEHK